MRTLTIALAVALSLPALARADGSIRCDGGLVSVGDTKLDLLGKCGAPTLRDAREQKVRVVSLAHDRTPGGRAKVTVTVEQWTYDFGPQRFVQLVTLEGGRITAIEQGSYGYTRDPAQIAVPVAVARCGSAALHVGDTKLDLLSRCGEPATVDVHTEEHASTLVADDRTVLVGSTTVEVEVWTYDFGPNSFIHVVTFANGKVTAVERGGYGYGRR